MNRKLILGCLAVFFSASLASADIVPNHSQNIQASPEYFQWQQGSPYIITASKSCGTTNLCIGQYNTVRSGNNGSQVITGGGFAFCNSIGSVGCPTIDNCIADGKINAHGSAQILKTVYSSDGTPYYAQPAR